LQRCRGRQKQKRKRLRKLSERPERWTLVEAAREGSLDDQLFEFITERTARSDAGAAVHQHVPDDPAGLASTKHELDLTAARAVFDGLTTRTLAYRTPGRYPAAKAATVFRVLAGLLGPSARWFYRDVRSQARHAARHQQRPGQQTAPTPRTATPPAAS
jgi:hypothetical protein